MRCHAAPRQSSQTKSSLFMIPAERKSRVPIPVLQLPWCQTRSPREKGVSKEAMGPRVASAVESFALCGAWKKVLPFVGVV